nr:hypothetical protein [uncultured Bdellovibrio sp.]
MRWSRAVMTLGICASVLSLVACKTDSSDKSSVQAPKKVQQTAPSPGKPLSPEEQARRASYSPNQLCYADLCVANSELSYPTMIQLATTATEEQKKYYADYISGPTLQMIEKKKASTQLFADLLSQHEGEFKNANLSEAQQRMVKAMLLVVTSNHLNTQIHENFRNKISSYDFMKAYSLSRVKGPQGYFDTLYPGVSTLQAAALEVQKVLDLENKINDVMKARIIDLEKASLTRIQKGEGVDNDDLSRMINNALALRMLDLLVIRDTALADSLPLSQESIKTIFFQSKIRDTLLARVEKSKDLSGVCEKNFYRAINLYPQTSEIGAFKETSEKVRAQVLQVLSQQDPAYQVVQKAPLYMPQDAKAIAARWSKAVKDSAEDARQEQENFKKLDSPSLMVLGTIFSLIYTADDKTCDEIVDLGISDATNTLDKGIKVSWISVKAPAYGASILAHEFGHLISKYSNAYGSQKACLADKQGTTKYIEEDFADVIASKVSVGLQNTLGKKQGNFGCLLASTDALPSLKNQDPTDVHSATLYRAIQVALMRKESLPESCKTAVQVENPKAVNSCE